MISTHNTIEYGVCDDSMTLYYYHSRSQTIFPGKNFPLVKHSGKFFVVLSWDHLGVLLFLLKLGSKYRWHYKLFELLSICIMFLGSFGTPF